MRRSSSKPLCGEAQGGVGVGEDGGGESLACWSGPGDTLSGRRPKAGSGGGGRLISMEANGD